MYTITISKVKNMQTVSIENWASEWIHKNKTQYEYILYKIYLSHAVDKRKDKKVTLLLCQGHPIIL